MLRQTADGTATLGVWSARAMRVLLPPQAETLPRDTAAGDLSRPTQLMLQSQWRPPLEKVKESDDEMDAVQTQDYSTCITVARFLQIIYVALELTAK